MPLLREKYSLDKPSIKCFKDSGKKSQLPLFPLQQGNVNSKSLSCPSQVAHQNHMGDWLSSNRKNINTDLETTEIKMKNVKPVL